MAGDVAVVQRLAERVRSALPECAPFLRPVPERFDADDPDHEVLRMPWPIDANHAQLAVYFRGGCFEIAFSVAGTRGPAEMQIVDRQGSEAMIADTVQWLEQLFAERIIVVVEQFRVLWFASYRIPFFQPSTDRIRHRVKEALSWRGTHNQTR